MCLYATLAENPPESTITDLSFLLSSKILGGLDRKNRLAIYRLAGDRDNIFVKGFCSNPAKKYLIVSLPMGYDLSLTTVYLNTMLTSPTRFRTSTITRPDHRDINPVSLAIFDELFLGIIRHRGTDIISHRSCWGGHPK